MTVNVLDVIDTTANQELLRKIAFQQSEAAPNVAKAFHGSVHATLGGLMKRAQFDEGAEQVANALHGFDSDVLANLELIVANGEIDSLALIGSTLTESVFESQLEAVVDVVQRHTAVRRSSAATLIGIATPLVFGALGHQKQSQALNAAGIQNLLSKQRPFLSQVAQRDLMAQLGLDDLLDPVAEPVDESNDHEPADDAFTTKKRKPRNTSLARPRHRTAMLAAMTLAMLTGAIVGWKWITSNSAQPSDQEVARATSAQANDEALAPTTVQAVAETITPNRSDAATSTTSATEDITSDSTTATEAAPTLNVARVTTSPSVEPITLPEQPEVVVNDLPNLDQADSGPALVPPALIANEWFEEDLQPLDPVELEPTSAEIPPAFESETTIAVDPPHAEATIAPATPSKTPLPELPEPSLLTPATSVERAELAQQTLPPIQQPVVAPASKPTARYAETLPTPPSPARDQRFGPNLETRRQRLRAADNFYRSSPRENWGFFRRSTSLN